MSDYALIEKETPLPTPVFNHKEALVKTTFYIAYVLLLTTGTLTFIEAISTNDKHIRHIMNVETCISIVAAYFYSQFIAKINNQSTIPYKEINLTRYTDWFITTPLMLLALCLVLSFNDKEKLRLSNYAIIIVLNFLMLAFGYMGETKQLDKRYAQILGFIFFFALFGFIWFAFLTDTKSLYSIVIYTIFIVIWSIYGLVYLLDEETKNTIFNILDTIAKCFVGIFFWLYFAKVITF